MAENPWRWEGGIHGAGEWSGESGTEHAGGASRLLRRRHRYQGAR